MSSVVQHTLHPWKKKIPIYAIDLAEGEGQPSWDPTVSGGLSPGWLMPDAARVGLNKDIMVPYDWIPGTDIKFYFVYSPDSMGGTGNIVLGIDYVLYADSICSSLGMNPARTVRTIVDTPPFGVVMKLTNTYVAIPGSELRGKRQIQIAFIRAGDLAEDTDNRQHNLIKVIMEYESYQP